MVGADGNPPGDGSVDGNDFAAFMNAYGAGAGLVGPGVLSSDGDAGLRRGYAGYEFDPVLGLAGASVYHVRNRVYDAENGRWTKRDPLGYVDGPSLYEYCRGMAMEMADSSGMRAAGRSLGRATGAASDWPMFDPLPVEPTKPEVGELRVCCGAIRPTLGLADHCWLEYNGPGGYSAIHGHPALPFAPGVTERPANCPGGKTFGPLVIEQNRTEPGHTFFESARPISCRSLRKGAQAVSAWSCMQLYARTLASCCVNYELIPSEGRRTANSNSLAFTLLSQCTSSDNQGLPSQSTLGPPGGRVNICNVSNCCYFD